MILRAAVFYRIAILSNSFIGGFFVVNLKYVFLQRYFCNVKLKYVTLSLAFSFEFS